jgi:hypothetical protein
MEEQTGQGPSQQQGQQQTQTNREQTRTRTEQFKVSGQEVVSKLKELVHQGNIRKIVLKNDQGKTLVEFPLTVGVVGAALLPIWAAIGTIAALVANLTIVVEKEDM